MTIKRKLGILASLGVLFIVAVASINNGSGGSASSVTFSGITGSTNSSAAMIVGTGASLDVSGSGTINATSLGGALANTYAPLVSPSFTTPTLGVATATSINKMAITAPATSSTLAVADGKTFTVSNSLTLQGTDGNSFIFPNGSGTVVTLAQSQTLSNKTLSSPIVTGVMDDQTIGYVTSNMGAQSSATCTNITGMTWNIAASKNYILRCQIKRTLAASATMQYCLGGPGSSTSYNITVRGLNGASSAYNQVDTAGTTSWQVKTTASSANANTAMDEVVANIQNGSTASGTALTLQTAANGTNNITVLADSACELKQVN